MKAGTHLVGALAVATAYDMFAPGTITPGGSGWESVVFYTAAFTGGLLPDICHPQSKAGRRISFFSRIIRGLFGHRTITHSLIFLVLIAFLAGLIPGSVGEMIQFGLCVGISSHFLLDAMTARGIHLFYPMPIVVRFPFHTRTGSLLGEGSVNVLCIAWVTYYTLSQIGIGIS